MDDGQAGRHRHRESKGGRSRSRSREAGAPRSRNASRLGKSHGHDGRDDSESGAGFVSSLLGKSATAAHMAAGGSRSRPIAVLRGGPDGGVGSGVSSVSASLLGADADARGADGIAGGAYFGRGVGLS